MVTYLTPEANIEAALLARLATLMLTPDFAVAWPGIIFPPAGQSLPENFLRIEHDAINVTRPFLSGTARQRGSLFVSVMMKIGTSSTKARDVAGGVAAHFPADHEMTSGGIMVRVIETPTVAGGYIDQTDARWRTPVIIPYEAWVQAS
jgi:hypothetical protein